MFSMKAQLESIPTGKESNTQTTVPRHGEKDNLWAEIRRMKARLSALEATLNIVRTMAMRTERKVYRDDGKKPEPETAPSMQANPNELNSLLWG